MNNERGGVTAGFFFAVAAIILCFGMLAVACGACTNTNNSLSPARFVSYHHDDDGDCQSGGCGNDQRRCSDAGDGCRGSFSPGPFDRSPVEISGNTVCVMPGSCPAPPPNKKEGPA